MENLDVLLSGLNPPQRQAVSTQAEHALILAGAGSGKTKVLVHRIAWLLQQGASPSSILAVTFTNKAANEMRERIEKITRLSASRLWIGTFHGLCHRILRQYWQEAGLPNNFQILDAHEQTRLIKRLLKEAHIDEKQISPQQAAYFINSCKEAGLRAKAVVPENYNPKQQLLLKIYMEYEQLCARSGVIDFTELLLRVVELLQNKEDIRQAFQARFQSILVDEFQDTNNLQYRWLKLLAEPTAKIFVVGDDDQSIYGWRGANIENIQQFSRDFPGTELIRLEQNYRSTGTILSAANALIGKNDGRLGKTLWTEQGDGQPIRVYQSFNDMDEARFVAHDIQCLLKEGHSEKDIAILYRSNAQSRILEQTLVQFQISYKIYGGVRFFDRAEIKDLLAYLQLIHNRHVDPAFLRVVNVPGRYIGDKTIAQIQIFSNENQLSLWQATETLLAQSLFTPRTKNALTEFMALVNQLDEEGKPFPLSSLIQLVMGKTKLAEYYQLIEPGEKGRMRGENLDELVHAARSFKPPIDSDNNASDLAHFLADAVLESEPQNNENAPSVHLMTLHAAKGLEFPFVFIVGMEEGLFPHSRSLYETNQLEEERRLCYVGITRAKQQLTLTCSEKRWFQGKEIQPEPSRFLSEIPEELFEAIHLKSQVKQPMASSFTSSATNSYRNYNNSIASTNFSSSPSPKPTRASSSNGYFKLGQRVFHEKFGTGTILNCEGEGPKSRVEIRFDRAGNKWLSLEYAQLKAV